MEWIDISAKIGADTTIGESTIVKKDVKIGSGCIIGHHVVIHEGTEIGDNVRIDDCTVVGKQPMRAKRSIFKSEPMPPAKIGSDSLIGAHVVVYFWAFKIRSKNLGGDCKAREVGSPESQARRASIAAIGLLCKTVMTI